MGPKWQGRFMDLAWLVASWSKDQSRQTGCVIVGPAREVIAVGYNGFPRGVNDEPMDRHARPAKYAWTEHAERNAIYNAARHGGVPFGCTLVTPWYPCADCARAIVQSGIVSLLCTEPDWTDPRYDFEIARAILAEGAVEVTYAKDRPRFPDAK